MEAKQNSLGIKGKDGQPLPKWKLALLFSFFIGTAALAFYIQIEEIWPTNTINNFQATISGTDEYYPKITFAILWMGTLIITAIPVVIFIKIFNKLTTKSK